MNCIKAQAGALSHSLGGKKKRFEDITLGVGWNSWTGIADLDHHTRDLFDAVQDALNGKDAAPVVHKKVNSEFPLKGFVMCTTCGKKLTAGFAKGRKEKYPRYWCWNPKCPAKVSAGREEIEMAFVRILGRLGPTQELINRLPEIARTYWAKRLERITNDRRTFSKRLADAKTLNQRILLQKVNGELSSEDFAILKETVTQQVEEAQNQLNALDAETLTMQSLLEETQLNIVDLMKVWNEGDTQRKQELAFSLFPEGLLFSRESHFFEPRNRWLWKSFRQLWDEMATDENIGAGDGI